MKRRSFCPRSSSRSASRGLRMTCSAQPGLIEARSRGFNSLLSFSDSPWGRRRFGRVSGLWRDLMPMSDLYYLILRSEYDCQRHAG